ncbi:unnamed protein product [Caenorhabditis angaria]|uniref:Uncharacterized protein n=1 Tax=Caenorhabditis angaria TaxID=860376 RepID=A0A9P1MRT7_9PELO|nr:unnamed protein product [Caenorhabditis angaria]
MRLEIEILLLLFLINLSTESRFNEARLTAKLLFHKIWEATGQNNKNKAEKYFANSFYFTTCDMNFTRSFFVKSWIDGGTRPDGIHLYNADFSPRDNYTILEFSLNSPKYNSEYLANNKTGKWRISEGRTVPPDLCRSEFFIAT